MSETVLVAVISLVGSIVTAMIGATVGLLTSDKQPGCRSIILSVGIFGIIGLVVTALLASLIIQPTAAAFQPSDYAPLRPTPFVVEPASGNVTPPTPRPQATPVNTARLRADVEEWIRSWAEAEDDPATWSRYYEGEALDRHKQRHDEFVATGLMLADASGEIIGDINVNLDSSAGFASAQLTAMANGSLIGNGQCMRVSGLQVAYTLFLRRVSDGWIIYRYYETYLNEPTMTQC